MLNRRHLLISAGALLAIPSLAKAAVHPLARVAAAQKAIAAQNAAKRAFNAKFILESLGENMTPVETRIAIFELVRRVPYKLTAWKGDPLSLFALGRGDCRHKAAAATRLLQAAGFSARQTLVTFDWADLPIPRDMLDLLTDTRSFHDTVVVSIDGKERLFDATWDPDLRAAGFPVLDRWDGVSGTLPITPGKLDIVRPEKIPKNVSIYDFYGFRWPVRKKTLEFNRRFNAWTDEMRTI